MAASTLIVGAGAAGVAFSFYQYKKVMGYKEEPMTFSADTESRGLMAASPGDEAKLDDIGASISSTESYDPVRAREMVEKFSKDIKDGAIRFLWQEYKYMFTFMIGFAALVLFLVGSGKGSDMGHGTASALAFVIGSLTSIVSGYIGMRIAVEANWRTTLAATDKLPVAFKLAFRGGAVMGFGLTSIGLLCMYLLIVILDIWYPFKTDALVLFEMVAGYGLGGSAIALFGRVGGGIYTKAADVGADLAGKIVAGLDEDDPRNPGVIADNVGDNVGDIAGMGADLFGSFAESTSAALVIAASSSELRADWTHLMFPLSISAAGILVCILVSFLATDCMVVEQDSQIERTLKMQLMVSTAVMTPVVYGLAQWMLPATFCVKALNSSGICPSSTPFHASLCIIVGLWAGLIIGIATEYFTSHSYSRGPVREVAKACRSSAASNIIFGLALGYESVILPVFLLSGSIFLSFKMCGMYGIALAALGMLSTLALGLTIDAYGPVADNAGGICEMSGYPKSVRSRTDALDAAGNTTAAIGKGFAIGSAALVSLALFGAFVTRTGVEDQGVDILQPITFAGLLFGAMLPYWFSALTMKSVAYAANDMVQEIKDQWNNAPGGMAGVLANPNWVPDYERCISISTVASLREMLKPGALTLLTPIIVGVLFGVQAVTGVLAGSLVSGVQMAISASNSGGAWDNAKKYIGSNESTKKRKQWVLVDGDVATTERPLDLGEPGASSKWVKVGEDYQPKMQWKKVNTPEYENAVTGDTVGDPLKDTSGPSLNILMKLMAIVSLVFADFFVAHSLNLGVTKD